eukprot:gene10920-biopygen8945
MKQTRNKNPWTRIRNLTGRPARRHGEGIRTQWPRICNRLVAGHVCPTLAAVRQGAGAEDVDRPGDVRVRQVRHVALRGAHVLAPQRYGNAAIRDDTAARERAAGCCCGRQTSARPPAPTRRRAPTTGGSRRARSRGRSSPPSGPPSSRWCTGRPPCIPPVAGASPRRAPVCVGRTKGPAHQFHCWGTTRACPAYDRYRASGMEHFLSGAPAGTDWERSKKLISQRPVAAPPRLLRGDAAVHLPRRRRRPSTQEGLPPHDQPGALAASEDRRGGGHPADTRNRGEIPPPPRDMGGTREIAKVLRKDIRAL